MQIIVIVCMARNGVIGRGNTMPWRMSSDLKHLRRTTMGCPLVMGRKTFASIGKALDGRVNYVVTRQPGLALTGAVVVGSIAEAIAIEQAKQSARFFIAGGGEIYRQALDLADTLVVTELAADIEGDTTFPVIDPQRWVVESRTPLATGPKDDYAADVIVYQRRV